MSQMSFLENTNAESEHRHTRHMLSVLLRKAQDHDWSVAELHKQVAELQNGMDAMHNKMDALLALLSGDEAALKALVVQGAVVPNEDEAAPIVSEELPPLASCPVCAKSADDPVLVEARFGYRTMDDGKVRVQSWCRECRSLGVQTQPGGRKPRAKMPDDVRALSTEATRLLKDGQAMIAEAMAGAAQRPGNKLSLDEQKKLETGTAMVRDGKAKQSEYNKQREAVSYPNGRPKKPANT
jgi:hypothetical protein